MPSSEQHDSSWPGTVFTVLILASVFYISKRYIVPLSWSALIAIASWPLYLRVNTLCQQRSSLASLIMTCLIIIAILLPITWLIVSVTQEALTAKTLLYQYNKTGIIMPNWLHHFPLFGEKISNFWSQYLSKPQFVENGITYLNQYHEILNNAVQAFGAKTLYHSISFFFFVLSVFFFFRDGHYITQRINTGGKRILAERWQNYMEHLPNAIRSVVNGTVLVGMGVGLLMGISYAIAGLPVPALFGFITAILAMIPFGMIITLIIVTVILLVKGNIGAAIAILIWGIIITFLSDHVIKPALIGSSTKLPFMMILIGILGGVETLGLIGLFLGPVIMVLFYTLFEEMTQ